MQNIILFTLLLTARYTGEIFAQKPCVVVSDNEGWYKISETTIDFKTETDEITVSGADRFDFIKIKVAEAPIHLVSFEIYFENGEKQSVTIGKEIKSPGETRIIQLNGDGRSLKKATFIYKTVANSKNKKAHIEIWGLKTNPETKTAN